MATVSRTDKENMIIQARLDKADARKKLIGSILPYCGLVFCLVFFTVVTKGAFLNPGNLINLIEQSFTLILIAVGASFVYAQGNMDFSIGAACGVAQMVGGLLLIKLNLPIPVALLATVLIPVVTSSVVALIAQVFHVPVFIGSMCVRSLLSGLLSIGVSRAEIIIPVNNYPYMNNNLIKALVLIAIIAIGYYLFNFTKVGKQGKLIGGNPVTARQVGIKVTHQVFLAYALLGICVGISAAFSMFRTGMVFAQSGSGIEFNMMLAMVLGGFAMSGGDQSKITSAIVGAITATLLTNGLSVWGLDPNLIGGLKGIVFVAIIGLSYDRSAGKLVS